MERLLRFESVIAICALLISAITGGAIVYQTHIIQSQYAATIWPYLSVDTDIINPRHVEVIVTNDGLGPALIRSAQLYVDGRHVPSWENFTALLSKGMPSGSATFGSSTINASTTIRPGETHSLITVKLGQNVSPKLLRSHRVELRFCYCSLNDSCWTLHAVPGVVTGEYPQHVASCPIDKGIGVQLL
jgi:hypothetical protein